VRLGLGSTASFQTKMGHSTQPNRGTNQKIWWRGEWIFEKRKGPRVDAWFKNMKRRRLDLKRYGTVWIRWVDEWMGGNWPSDCFHSNPPQSTLSAHSIQQLWTRARSMAYGIPLRSKQKWGKQPNKWGRKNFEKKGTRFKGDDWICGTYTERYGFVGVN
jgi:hypothetical protein